MKKKKKKLFPSYEEIYAQRISKGLSEKLAHRQATKLLSLSKPLRKIFVYWWHTGKLREDLTFKGITISYLESKWNYGFICAFIDLDHLLKNPDDARHLRHLKKGLSHAFLPDDSDWDKLIVDFE